MKKEKGQSFIKGAAILATAGIVVKILGALYKIPLGAILGPIGMANFSIAYNIYALLFVISTAGVPAAVSKMVSESTAKGGLGGETRRIYKTSFAAFVSAGALGFAFMFIFAEKIAILMGCADAAIAIRVISPAVLFVSISAINRGYHQGCADMLPTAISEILEAIGKLLIGLFAAWYLKCVGEKSAVISAGAVSGVSAGAFLSAIYFAFHRIEHKKSIKKVSKSKRKIIRELLSLALPITLSAAVISLSNVIDSALVMNLLQKDNFSEYRAKWLFGAYAYATTIFNLPSALIATLSVSLLPALSGCIARREFLKADKTAGNALEIAMIIAIPAAGGMAAISYGIIDLLYGAGIDNECIAVSSKMLKYLSAAVPPLALVTITNSIHQAMGKANIPVFSMIAGALVKILSNFLLVGRADINIYGAAISTVLCYIIIAVLNIAALRKYPFIEMNISTVLTKPIVVGTAVFCASRAASGWLNAFMDIRISTILSVFAGVLAWLVSSFFVGAPAENSKKVRLGLKNILKFFDNSSKI